MLSTLDELVSPRNAEAMPALTSTVRGRLGAFYDVDGVARLAGTSSDVVLAAVASRDLLVLRTSDSVLLFPVFQFDELGRGLPRLREVVSALDPEDRHPDGSALWLVVPAAALGGLSPSDALRAGRGGEVVAIAARIGAAAAH